MDFNMKIQGIFFASPNCGKASARQEHLMLPTIETKAASPFEYQETKDLVNLVESASELIRSKGENAFLELSTEGSRWRNKKQYVFVLSPGGTMLVHPDPTLAGNLALNLKDISGRPIIQGLIDAATSNPEKPQGWFHYQWPEPGDLSPQWKSSFVKKVLTRENKTLIVGSGMYNNRMERTFVIDMVKEAALQIQSKGKDGFASFYDQTGRFIAKDSYVFVIDPKGVCLVHPAFPNLQGHNLIYEKDSTNRYFIREMLDVANENGSGWVDYLWPKPGESIPTQKSSYVEKVKFKDSWVLVGCGVYLADAPVSAKPVPTLSADAVIRLVNESAAMLSTQGESAYAEFRKAGNKWRQGSTYLFSMDSKGTRKLNAARPNLEGLNIADEKDIHGRPYGKMMLEIAHSKSGEGWVHYLYPKPGNLFPMWKSAFCKRVILPDGEKHLLCAGSYAMAMNDTLIEDVVNQAAMLIQQKGPAAFQELRDPHEKFRFMDTYIFVNSNDAMELVNGGTPYMEGKNVANLKDAKGTPLAINCIKEAKEKGKAWVDCYWYKPGENIASLKKTFVKKVEFGKDWYVVGSGYYV
jgi:signal transduction histidine kinase